MGSVLRGLEGRLLVQPEQQPRVASRRQPRQDLAVLFMLVLEKVLGGRRVEPPVEGGWFVIRLRRSHRTHLEVGLHARPCVMLAMVAHNRRRCHVEARGHRCGHAPVRGARPAEVGADCHKVVAEVEPLGAKMTVSALEVLFGPAFIAKAAREYTAVSRVGEGGVGRAAGRRPLVQSTRCGGRCVLASMQFAITHPQEGCTSGRGAQPQHREPSRERVSDAVPHHPHVDDEDSVERGMELSAPLLDLTRAGAVRLVDARLALDERVRRELGDLAIVRKHSGTHSGRTVAAQERSKYRQSC